jgi:hypothetical protein
MKTLLKIKKKLKMSNKHKMFQNNMIEEDRDSIEVVNTNKTTIEVAMIMVDRSMDIRIEITKVISIRIKMIEIS